VEGTYTIDATATGTNTGTVTIGNGAKVEAGVGVSISGDGINIVEAGGTVIADGNATNPLVGASTDADAQIQLTSGTFSYNNTSYVLKGVATVTNFNISDTDMWFNKETVVLTIHKDAELTVATSAEIGLGGSMDADSAPVVGDLTGSGSAAAPKITFTGTGVFTGSSTYKYFYPNGSRTGGDPVSGKTYEWKADVNSTGNAGWEATTS
jgi:hypothetical protein